MRGWRLLTWKLKGPTHRSLTTTSTATLTSMCVTCWTHPSSVSLMPSKEVSSGYAHNSSVHRLHQSVLFGHPMDVQRCDTDFGRHDLPCNYTARLKSERINMIHIMTILFASLLFCCFFFFFFFFFFFSSSFFFFFFFFFFFLLKC